MFNNINEQLSKSSIIRVSTLLIILLELMICGSRTALGRHLHRLHSSLRSHGEDAAPLMMFMSPNYVDENDNRIGDFEKLLENPKRLSPQPQPEDFVFPTDSYPDLNFPIYEATVLKNNEKLVDLNDNEIYEHTIKYEKENEEITATSSPVKPPVIEGRNIIVAPLKECKNGQRLNSKGICKTVLK